MGKAVFITGTDTDVGKTIATFVLGVLFQAQGLRVGVMKPVQCSGDDAGFLIKSLNLNDDIREVNPYYAPEPLSPHLAFSRHKIKVRIDKIKQQFLKLKERYDILLVEGAGGLMVPINKNFLMIDLIKELDIDAIVISRLSLGTINHTLLTVEQLRHKGINVRGVIFNQVSIEKESLAAQTNPGAIRQYGKVDVLGTIPCLKELTRKQVLSQVTGIKLQKIISDFKKDESKKLVEWDKKYLWHPFTQMKDWLEEELLIIDQAKGSYLIDTKGNRYLDGISSLWVTIHGHSHEKINQAIKDQLNQLDHSTMLGLGNTPAVKLAKELVAITPAGLNKVFYSDSGSTSVEIAVKIAYQYWQNIGKTKKRKIVHLANSYHGDTLGSVSVGGIDLFHEVYADLIPDTVQIDFPDCYRAPKGKKYPDYAFECVDRFEKWLKKDYGNVAAFVVESSIQGAAGMIMWPKGILKRMAQICKKYDVIFIIDEVATGFGRTGTMFACEQEKVSPDILCLAKGITGGYLPLAATLTTDRIYDGFLFDYQEQKTFFHGHTYTGNPLACAAALANLEVFRQEKTLQKLQSKIKFVVEQLKRFKKLKYVGDVRQRGMMIGIELVQDKKTKEPFSWEERMGMQVCHEVRQHGVILRPLGNVIVLMPPLSMTRQELKKVIDVAFDAIKKVTEGKVDNE